MLTRSFIRHSSIQQVRSIALATTLGLKGQSSKTSGQTGGGEQKWMTTDGRVGRLAIERTSTNAKILYFGVRIGVRHPPPPSSTDVRIVIVFAFQMFTRDTIRTSVYGGSSKRTMLDRGGGPKSHFFCQDVFDGSPLTIYFVNNI